MFKNIALSFEKPKAFLAAQMEKRKTTLGQDAFVCIAAALACSFYHFEYYHPYMDLVRSLLAVLFFYVWFSVSFINGVRKRYGFLIFLFCYWLLPQLFIGWQNYLDSTADYLAAVDVLSQFSKFLVYYPFVKWYELPAGKLPPALILAGYLIVCLAMYLIGYAVKKQLDEKEG